MNLHEKKKKKKKEIKLIENDTVSNYHKSNKV